MAVVGRRVGRVDNFSLNKGNFSLNKGHGVRETLDNNVLKMSMILDYVNKNKSQDM